jgi:hypothetical protein
LLATDGAGGAADAVKGNVFEEAVVSDEGYEGEIR